MSNNTSIPGISASMASSQLNLQPTSQISPVATCNSAEMAFMNAITAGGVACSFDGGHTFPPMVTITPDMSASSGLMSLSSAVTPSQILAQSASGNSAAMTGSQLMAASLSGGQSLQLPAASRLAMLGGGGFAGGVTRAGVMAGGVAGGDLLQGPALQSAMSQQCANERRSSSRSIKRKKFDDEVVESSLLSLKAERGRTAAGGGRTDIKLEPADLLPLPPPETRRKPSRCHAGRAGRRSKRSTVANYPPTNTKDLGRWKPQDDLLLITNVQQTQDLLAVHTGTKFSCRFTLREVQERWYALLYHPPLSKLATAAIRQLHTDVIASVYTKALYSREEEALLGTLPATSAPTAATFTELLQTSASTFLPARTAAALHTHWLLLKQSHLLPDQAAQPLPRGEHVLNFSDAEELLEDDSELRQAAPDLALTHEMAAADRRQKREIRHLEAELPRWQVLVDSVTGAGQPDFDTQTLAVLRGRLVRYLMRSREISLGRACADRPIDVDLSLEGPAWKISRRQGVIKLRSNGDFYLANEGKRPIFVDGRPVLAGTKARLVHNTVLEISCLRFIFLINTDLISVIRNEAHKLPAAAT